jgi:plasmid stability protein
MRDLGIMPRNLQVRDIPDPLHRELKRRAKARGETLTDYVQSILEREVARPPAEEVFRRIALRPPVDLGKSAADLIREEREGR